MQAQEAFKFNMITTYSLLCIKIFLLHFKLLKEFPLRVFQLSILFRQITKRHKVKKTCLCYMRNSQSHSQSWLLHKKDKKQNIILYSSVITWMLLVKHPFLLFLCFPHLDCHHLFTILFPTILLTIKLPRSDH